MKKAKERLNAKQNLIHLKIKVNTFIYLRLMIILVLLIFCASLKKPGIFIFIILGSIIYFGSEAIFYDYPLFTKRKKEYDEFIEFLSFLKLEPNLKENVIDSIINVLNEVNYSFSDTLRSIAQKRKYGEKENLDVTILSGDRDTFQLVTNKITVRIPRTKQGKTETDDYTKEKVIEEYGLEPKLLIDVKGLQGDTSDNIPGVAGIGPKTAIELIKKYGSIENLYNQIEKGLDDIKGKQREKLVENKDLAYLSKTLGTIDTSVPY